MPAATASVRICALEWSENQEAAAAATSAATTRRLLRIPHLTSLPEDPAERRRHQLHTNHERDAGRPAAGVPEERRHRAADTAADVVARGIHPDGQTAIAPGRDADVPIRRRLRDEDARR